MALDYSPSVRKAPRRKDRIDSLKVELEQQRLRLPYPAALAQRFSIWQGTAVSKVLVLT